MTNFPFHREIPSITSEQMREVDRSMTEDLLIDLTQMMENAGRNLAHLARERFLDMKPSKKTVVVLAGSGGNGGGALVCARRLHNYGADVHVVISKNLSNFSGVTAHQLEILKKLTIDIEYTHNPKIATDIDLIIDGLIGYSLDGEPHGVTAELIRWANNQRKSILSLDAPSGIDTTHGIIHEPVIQATATMTLALPKTGLNTIEALPYVGEYYLADISVPPELYLNPPISMQVGNIFESADIVRIR